MGKGEKESGHLRRGAGTCKGPVVVGGSMVGEFKGAVCLEIYKQEEEAGFGGQVFLTVLGSEAPGKVLLSLLR